MAYALASKRQIGFLEKLQDSSKNVGHYRGSERFNNLHNKLIFARSENQLKPKFLNNHISETNSSFSVSNEGSERKETVVGK